jgi:hypothetical protein
VFSSTLVKAQQSQATAAAGQWGSSLSCLQQQRMHQQMRWRQPQEQHMQAVTMLHRQSRQPAAASWGQRLQETSSAQLLSRQQQSGQRQQLPKRLLLQTLEQQQLAGLMQHMSAGRQYCR